MSAAPVDVGVVSHPGLAREQNEDAVDTVRFPLDGGSYAVVVADGMGGHRGGAVASRAVVDGIRTRLLDLDVALEPLGADWQRTLSAHLEKTVREINHEIRMRAESERQLAGMGATVVLALFVRDWVGVLHVGDSRAYRLRGPVLRRLTIDHSWNEEQRVLGEFSDEDIRNSPFASQLTRVVGYYESVEPTLVWERLAPGDLFLLCTDGLTKHLGGREIASFVTSGDPLDDTANQLVAAANRKGGRDNITVALAKWHGSEHVSLPPPDVETAPRRDLAAAVRNAPVEYVAESDRPGGAFRTRFTVGITSSLVLTLAILAWAGGRYLSTPERPDRDPAPTTDTVTVPTEGSEVGDPGQATESTDAPGGPDTTGTDGPETSSGEQDPEPSTPFIPAKED